jgi:hypothetical protein
MPDTNAGNFLDDLSNSDKAFLGGSLVLFIAMFLPWYGAEVSSALYSVSESINGFYGWGYLTFVALLAVVAFWVIRKFFSKEITLPEMPVTDAVAIMIGGAIEVVGVLLVWVAGHPAFANFNFPGYSSGVRFGLFIALIGGIATIVAGYLKQSEPAAAVPATPSAPPPSYGAPTSYGTPPPPATPPSAPPPAAPPPSGPPPSAPPAV